MALAWLVFLADVVPAQQKAPPTIEQIHSAWEARQNRVRSARFTWKEQRTWPKGSISASFGSELELRVPSTKGKVMPPGDTTVDFSYTLTMDKDKTRFEYEGEEWANDKQAFRDVKYLSAFDGKTAKTLYPEGVGHGNWPVAVIHKGPNYPDAGLAALRPLLLVYRPFVATLQPSDIRAMTLLQQGAVIQGRPCLELMRRLPGNSSMHLWVDTAREFLLVRRLIVQQSEPFEQLDIDYAPHASVGWVPTAWKFVNNGPRGKPLCTIEAVVASVEFNMPVEESSFDFPLPPGARVQDQTKMENYILRHDRTKRPILPADIGATYEQMLNSAPGEALTVKESGKGTWWVVTAGAIVLSLGVVLIWRRVRLSESPRARRQ